MRAERADKGRQTIWRCHCRSNKQVHSRETVAFRARFTDTHAHDDLDFGQRFSMLRSGGGGQWHSWSMCKLPVVYSRSNCLSVYSHEQRSATLLIQVRIVSYHNTVIIYCPVLIPGTSWSYRPKSAWGRFASPSPSPSISINRRGFFHSHFR